MTARAEEAVASLGYRGETSQQKCGCEQPIDLPPSGGSNEMDRAVIKGHSDAHGPGETGETEIYPSMVLVPSLYKIG